MRKFIYNIIGKILNIELEGTKVVNKKTGVPDVIDKTTTNFELELPLFFLSFHVKYKLRDRGVVSKSYFDMNYEVDNESQN
jgi:hypothetical protein